MKRTSSSEIDDDNVRKKAAKVEEPPKLEAGTDGGGEKEGSTDGASSTVAVEDNKKPKAVVVKAKGDKGRKCKNFAERVMRLLQNGIGSDTIYWIGDGKAIAVNTRKLKRGDLLSELKVRDYGVFIRSCNRWGFRRTVEYQVPQGVICYKCSLFQRDEPQLVHHMRMDSDVQDVFVNHRNSEGTNAPFDPKKIAKEARRNAAAAAAATASPGGSRAAASAAPKTTNQAAGTSTVGAPPAATTGGGVAPAPFPQMGRTATTNNGLQGFPNNQILQLVQGATNFGIVGMPPPRPPTGIPPPRPPTGIPPRPSTGMDPPGAGATSETTQAPSSAEAQPSLTSSASSQQTATTNAANGLLLQQLMGAAAAAAAGGGGGVPPVAASLQHPFPSSSSSPITRTGLPHDMILQIIFNLTEEFLNQTGGQSSNLSGTEESIRKVLTLLLAQRNNYNSERAAAQLSAQIDPLGALRTHLMASTNHNTTTSAAPSAQQVLAAAIGTAAMGTAAPPPVPNQAILQAAQLLQNIDSAPQSSANLSNTLVNLQRNQNTPQQQEEGNASTVSADTLLRQLLETNGLGVVPQGQHQEENTTATAPTANANADTNANALASVLNLLQQNQSPPPGR